jgi:hypothetical protein
MNSDASTRIYPPKPYARKRPRALSCSTRDLSPRRRPRRKVTVGDGSASIATAGLKRAPVEGRAHRRIPRRCCGASGSTVGSIAGARRSGFKHPRRDDAPRDTTRTALRRSGHDRACRRIAHQPRATGTRRRASGGEDHRERRCISRSALVRRDSVRTHGAGDGGTISPS